MIVQTNVDSGAVHGGYGTSIGRGALDSEVTFNAGWSDGHVATVWVFVSHRDTGAADDGCYVNVMALTR
jgi:hypothetical protein